MNTERSDFDSALRAWFSDGPTVMSDRVVDGIAARIARQPQRRMWRLPGRPFMNMYAKLAVAAAAIVIVGFVGLQLLPGGGFGGQPTPSPAPTPSPSPTPSPEPYQCEEGTGCLGELAAGTHGTSQFAPSFSYTTPADWFNQIDIPTLVGITPADQPADMLLVWSGAVPAERTAGCVLQPKAGAGTTAEDWVAYLESHPGLLASNIRSLTIGGRAAQSVDIRINLDWVPPCAADQADHDVPILKTPAGAPGDGYGVARNSIARVYLVDVGGEAVVVTLYAYSGGDAIFATQVAKGEPVVTSFTFDAP